MEVQTTGEPGEPVLIALHSRDRLETGWAAMKLSGLGYICYENVSLFGTACVSLWLLPIAQLL